MRHVLTFIVAFVPTIALAAEEDAKAARRMWAMFECGTYAEIGGNDERQAALFEQGVIEGKRYLSAREAGTITEEELNRHVPLVVALMVGGPSIEFVLGRLFESAMRSAYDDVTKADLAGKSLPMAEWINDPELKIAHANIHYQRSNCDLF